MQAFTLVGRVVCFALVGFIVAIVAWVWIASLVLHCIQRYYEMREEFHKRISEPIGEELHHLR